MLDFTSSFSHYKTLKTPMKFHDLGQKRITTTQVKTIQYVPQTIDNSSISQLICLQMQKKVLKT